MLTKKMPAKLYLPIIIIIAILVIYSISLTAWSFMLDPVHVEEVTVRSIYRSINYDYKVFPLDSILYPQGSGQLAPDDAPFYELLTDNIIFRAEAQVMELVSSDLEHEEIDFVLKLLLRSPDQWEIEMPFRPDISRTRSEDGPVEFSAVFSLPLKDAHELGEIIAEETGVRPRGGINLVVRSNIITASEGNSAANLDAEYVFTLTGSLIEPTGELFFKEGDEVVDVNTTINYLSLPGLDLPVAQGRIIFPISLVVFAAAGTVFAVEYRRRLAPAEENILAKRKKIKKRYSGKAIKIRDLKGIVSSDAIIIEVNGMADLMKVSDELEKPLLQLNSIENDEEAMDFYVVGEKTVYSYKA